jgi:hypothetical protein
MTTMTDQSVAGGQPAALDPQSRLMAMQGLVNRIVRGVLRTPGLSRLAGERLVTVYVTGRKSGRRYTVPVAYTRYEGDLLIGTPFGWSRNLRTGEPVAIRLKGRRREADVTALYAVMCKDNGTFAKFAMVSFDADGNPNQDELRRVWAAGARAIRLTPR